MASLSSDFQLVNQETVKETTTEVIKTESNKKIIFQRFMRHKPAVIGLTVFILMVLVALLAPVMTQFDPNLITADFEAKPDTTYWLGTAAIKPNVVPITV
ncbi:hypothetical protein [Jeotgalibaca porci]|uniref:hypothetical protein n=1 Tax=Jeotgalibaca porci TaxID=1868793 RepID=UPI0035A15769